MQVPGSYTLCPPLLKKLRKIVFCQNFAKFSGSFKLNLNSNSDSKIGRFYQPTKSANFCMTEDRFLSADFIARQLANFINRPTSP